MKNAFPKAIQSLLHSHFFISLIAVVLALETAIVLQMPFAHWSIYVFLFSSTFFAYNVYYIKSENAFIYRILSSIALLANVIVVFFIPVVYFAKLIFIALASGIYIFPVFYTFKKKKNFTFQKLLLLIFIWVFSTFLLPISSFQIEYHSLLLLIFRICILAVSCLYFFVRDESNRLYKKQAILYTYILSCLSIIVAILVLLFVDVSVGFVYLFVSVLSVYLAILLYGKQWTNSFYLAYADGILFLQSACIIILYFLHAL